MDTRDPGPATQDPQPPTDAATCPHTSLSFDLTSCCLLDPAGTVTPMRTMRLRCHCKNCGCPMIWTGLPLLDTGDKVVPEPHATPDGREARITLIPAPCTPELYRQSCRRPAPGAPNPAPPITITELPLAASPFRKPPTRH